jgi:hypothetical protein
MCSIAGSRDPLRIGVEAMRGAVPDIEVVILDGVDHMQAPRHPELLRTLTSFLRRHSAGAPRDDPGAGRPQGGHN